MLNTTPQYLRQSTINHLPTTEQPYLSLTYRRDTPVRHHAHLNLKTHTHPPSTMKSRALQLLRPLRLSRPPRRHLSIEPQAPPPPKPPSKVGAFYKTFTAPLLKTFLGALFTYQLAYYGWLKLETIEEAHGKEMEIRGLRVDLAGAISGKRERVEGVVEKVGETVAEVKDKVIEGTEGVGVTGRVAKGGWWPW